MDDSFPLLQLKKLCGPDVYMDPMKLNFVKEFAEGESVVVELANLVEPGSNPETKKSVVVKSYRPHILQTHKDMRTVVDHVIKFHKLDHK